jgi:signal transduction histidine kinase
MSLRNPFTTFRVQIVVFMAITLLVTALVLSLVNQRLERRTTSQVDEYIQAITLANDLVYRSFSSGTYLYELVNNPDQSSLVINDQSIIRSILLVEEDGKVYDSTDRAEIGRQLRAEFKDVPQLRRGDVSLENENKGGDQLRTMTSSLTTDKGKRSIVVVISMDRLQRVKDSVSQIRLAALGAMGVALILLIAWYSRRATRPIADLAAGARRVSKGDLDFEVRAVRRDEIGTLSQTFNEMLADLRRKKELEEQLRRAEQSAVVGRLASGIAHEIRNPLNFINLTIDHLRASIAPSGEPARLLGMIKDEIGRLNGMVSDFLSYGRPARLKLRKLDARALINELSSIDVSSGWRTGRRRRRERGRRR